MNWKTFAALLRRDAQVARRNAKALLMQTLFQPMMFVLGPYTAGLRYRSRTLRCSGSSRTA